MSCATSEETVTEADFQEISELVYRHCGIMLHDGKRELVQARLARQLRLHGLTTAREYLDRVLADGSGEEFRDFIDSLSTNLTSFFRESRHFDYLRQTFLPQLVQRRRTQGQRSLRAWSAGCSSGEEAYTIGITVLDALGQDRKAWDVLLLATDISTRVLRTAGEGVYNQERVQAVPADSKQRYFTADRSDGRTLYRVGDDLREMVRFRYLNLMENWPFSGPFDFIFCRNVMIYFDKPTQQRLVNRFFDVLAPGGLLFTGHSESLTGITHRFGYVEPTIYRKS